MDQANDKCEWCGSLVGEPHQSNCLKKNMEPLKVPELNWFKLKDKNRLSRATQEVWIEVMEIVSLAMLYSSCVMNLVSPEETKAIEKVNNSVVELSKTAVKLIEICEKAANKRESLS